jgi:hypothetical protein
VFLGVPSSLEFLDLLLGFLFQKSLPFQVDLEFLVDLKFL